MGGSARKSNQTGVDRQVNDKCTFFSLFTHTRLSSPYNWARSDDNQHLHLGVTYRGIGNCKESISNIIRGHVYFTMCLLTYFLIHKVLLLIKNSFILHDGRFQLDQETSSSDQILPPPPQTPTSSLVTQYLIKIPLSCIISMIYRHYYMYLMSDDWLINYLFQSQFH